VWGGSGGSDLPTSCSEGGKKHREETPTRPQERKRSQTTDVPDGEQAVSGTANNEIGGGKVTGLSSAPNARGKGEEGTERRF